MNEKIEYTVAWAHGNLDYFLVAVDGNLRLGFLPQGGMVVIEREIDDGYTKVYERTFFQAMVKKSGEHAKG